MGLTMQADAGARRGRRDGKARQRGTKVLIRARPGPRGYHSWLKHYTRRVMRRWAKQDPELAPRRPYYSGYET